MRLAAGKQQKTMEVERRCKGRGGCVKLKRREDALIGIFSSSPLPLGLPVNCLQAVSRAPFNCPSPRLSGKIQHGIRENYIDFFFVYTV